MTDRALTAWEAVPATAAGNDGWAMKPIAPGFRFHPSDEELISYYLKRKVHGKPMRVNPIGEVDVYKHEPADLEEHSKLKTKDQEWFFFSTLEKKFSSGAYINRATKKGSWNKTGVDKEILRDRKLIGIVKSFVFYRGRAPKCHRTNWMIHEYRLVDGQGLEIDAYVLCKVFLKKDAGPSKGNIYAPFSEQDWDDDGGRAPVPRLVHANRIDEKIQQENYTQRENLSELLRVFYMEDNPKTVDQDDSNDEPLTRECLPLCVLNKEAPVPLIQYKHKLQIDSFGSYRNSIPTIQDHCSFPTTTGDTISSIAATLEEKEPEPVAAMVPKISSTELTNDLQTEKQQMAVEREAYKLEIMLAEAMISILGGQVDALRAENEELKKNNSNKGQCSN